MRDSSGIDGPILSVWRAPERLLGDTAWTAQAPRIEIAVFGEAALGVAGRTPDGAATVRAGRVTVPHGASAGIHVLDTARSAAGTLTVSGPMVPRQPEGAGLDTLYPCRLDRETNRFIIAGPPAGLASVGGYRFALGALQELISDIDSGGTLAALPDILAGQRLAGAAADRNAICDALAARGANPLLIAAFRARRADRAA